jgi:hypothetical protein
MSPALGAMAKARTTVVGTDRRPAPYVAIRLNISLRHRGAGNGPLNLGGGTGMRTLRGRVRQIVRARHRCLLCRYAELHPRGERLAETPLRLVSRKLILPQLLEEVVFVFASLGLLLFPRAFLAIDAARVFVLEVPDPIAAEEAVPITRHGRPRYAAALVFFAMNASSASRR